MTLTPNEIHNKEFTRGFRGYKEDDVNEFLSLIMKDYEDYRHQSKILEDQNSELRSKLEKYTGIKDSLNKSILIAQEAVATLKKNAQDESNLIIREAEKNADRILNEALAKTSRITLENEELRNQVSLYKSKFKMLVESQMKMISETDWLESQGKQNANFSEILENTQKEVSDLEAKESIDHFKSSFVEEVASEVPNDNYKSSEASVEENNQFANLNLEDLLITDADADPNPDPFEFEQKLGKEIEKIDKEFEQINKEFELLDQVTIDSTNLDKTVVINEEIDQLIKPEDNLANPIEIEEDFNLKEFLENDDFLDENDEDLEEKELISQYYAEGTKQESFEHGSAIANLNAVANLKEDIIPEEKIILEEKIISEEKIIPEEKTPPKQKLRFRTKKNFD